MKKLIFCIISMMLFIYYSCSVNDLIKPAQKADQNGLAADDASARKPHGPVFTVLPNGTDDTENILQAFADAKAAGPGSVVQLVTGQYTIGFIEVREFEGYFRGAGKDKSVISNLPGLPCNDLWAVDNCPYLLQFVGGNITISDMSIHIIDGNPCNEPQMYRDYFGDVMVTVLILADYTSTYVPANRHINGVVKNVDFIAGDIEGGFNPYGLSSNTNMAIYCGSPWMVGTGNNLLSNGEISIMGCGFEQTMVGPDIAGFAENSKINIENNVITGNVYGLYMFSNLGTASTIKDNKFKESVLFDAMIDDNDYGYYPDVILHNQTKWAITGNNFQSLPGVISLYLSDYRRTVLPGEGFPQLFDIKGNTFNTQNGGTAVLGMNSVDAKIWNNKFTGNGSTGIYLDGNQTAGVFAEKDLLLGNNFSTADFTEADIYLGENTRNCTVIGGKNDNVIDNGINNKIINVPRKTGHRNWKGHHFNGHHAIMHRSLMAKEKP